MLAHPGFPGLKSEIPNPTDDVDLSKGPRTRGTPCRGEFASERTGALAIASYSQKKLLRPCQSPALALMDDLERVSVRIKHISGVVSRIVFDARPRREIVFGASGYRSHVELIDFFIAVGHEAPMN